MEIHEAYSEIRELYEKAKCDYKQSADPKHFKNSAYKDGKKVAYEKCLEILEQIPVVIRLSDCPFCGGAASFLEERVFGLSGQDLYLRVQCQECGVKTNKIKLLNADGECDEENERVAKLKLAKTWNKRK